MRAGLRSATANTVSHVLYSFSTAFRNSTASWRGPETFHEVGETILTRVQREPQRENIFVLRTSRFHGERTTHVIRVTRSS